MPRRDTIDFALAFALGATAGAIAATMLRPSPPRRATRVREEIEDHAARLRKTARRARQGFADGFTATAEMGDVVRNAGRDILRDAREDAAEIVADVQAGLREAVDGRPRRAARAIRLRARRALRS